MSSIWFVAALAIELCLLASCAARDGRWTKWSEWKACSVSCGQGQRSRYRECRPTPSLGGKWCQGNYRESKQCNTGVPCSVHGEWGQWTPWTVCSVSCGEGNRHRYRVCDSPHPASEGNVCQGSAQESQACFALKDCPRDGKWSSWSQWSSCSVTCGQGGSIHRYRSCNNPPPSGNGRPCDGLAHSVQSCQAKIKCPVNGQWSEWTEWTECSVTCGAGEQRRWRGCDEPPPLFGGNDCNRTEAGELQIRSCNGDLLHCPVDGKWSEWGEWGDCNTPNCESSTQPAYSLRQRSCDSPRPAHNGSMCQGTFLQAGLCLQPINCRVDGGWSEWSGWTCLKELARRTRVCNNPLPSNGGRPCKGSKIEFYSREDEHYSELCPNFSTDDEDLSGFSGSGSGMQVESEEEEIIDPRIL
ncbi:properdin isoform X1 [Parasteatoda tepidariorum]|uniref:properdin isoform X1 n=1 Tax=Parasteatoda tepidariorum TaxID=114398 RepID=UPI001C727AB6|nr:coadhesin isoform X1 [Parasteatoda tepidariorum]